MESIDPLLQDALTLHQRGDLIGAAAAYRRTLELDPRHPQALHLLGIIELEANHLDSARQLLVAAAQAAPAAGGPWFHLGEVARRQGATDEAVAAFRKAIELQPDLLVAYQSLGDMLLQRGRPAEAVDPLKALTQFAPTMSGAFLLFGRALLRADRPDEAIEPLQQTVRLAPGAPAGHLCLAEALFMAGQMENAAASLRRAIELREDNAEAHSLLAKTLDALGNSHDALIHHRRAAELLPTSAASINNYALALKGAGQLASAEAQARHALELQPTDSAVTANLGSIYREQCRQADAMTMYRKAVELDPNSIAARSVLIYGMHFDPDSDDASVGAEQREWDRRFGADLPPVASHETRDRKPDRRLRVGYVSYDLRRHVIGRFLEPIVRFHDRDHFEVFAYSDVTAPDDQTERLKPLFENWRDTAGLSDRRLAETIADDRIDILVDVTGHMHGNRLLTFARRPAPVQISHIGYPASPGLSSIKFRITDRHLDPPGSASPSDEILLRLPNSFYLYTAYPEAPDPAGPPMRKGGPVTFGSLNSPVKTTLESVELWAAVLRRFPRARMMLIVPIDGSANPHVAAMFARFGVPETQLIFQPARANLAEFLGLYHLIDVALDPQPYGSGITGCDSLWMGVPVVSKVGRTSVGRMGASLLRTVRLPELVADTQEQFVQAAAALIDDPQKLTRLRFELRGRMRDSALMDAVRYTRDLESLYRQAWRIWCDEPS